MLSVSLWGSHPAALESRGYWMLARCQEKPPGLWHLSRSKGTPNVADTLCYSPEPCCKKQWWIFSQSKGLPFMYISTTMSISSLRLIYYLVCENKLCKGLAWQAPEVVWRHNHHTPVKRELQLGFIVSSPLDWLMTVQPPSRLSIWDFTAAVYKWDFHDKQFCIQFPCISESKNDLLRLCWEGVLMKTKSISGYFPQEHYHNDNIMTLPYTSTLSPHPSPEAALQDLPAHTCSTWRPSQPPPHSQHPPSHGHLKRKGSATSLENFLPSLML